MVEGEGILFYKALARYYVLGMGKYKLAVVDLRHSGPPLKLIA